MPARLLWKLMPQRAARLFADDLDLIRVVGLVKTGGSGMDELEAHRYHHPPCGLLRGPFMLRVSGKKLMRLVKEVLPRNSSEWGFTFRRPEPAAPSPMSEAETVSQ